MLSEKEKVQQMKRLQAENEELRRLLGVFSGKVEKEKGNENGKRKNLKEARQRAGLTQKAVAKYLGTTLRSYQRFEDGQLLGKIKHWDALEDLLGIHQRELRLVFQSEEEQTDKE